MDRWRVDMNGLLPVVRSTCSGGCCNLSSPLKMTEMTKFRRTKEKLTEKFTANNCITPPVHVKLIPTK